MRAVRRAISGLNFRVRSYMDFFFTVSFGKSVHNSPLVVYNIICFVCSRDSQSSHKFALHNATVLLLYK